MNNIELLEHKIAELEKENSRLKNAIVHLVRDFPRLDEMPSNNFEESFSEEGIDSPMPGIKRIFPDFPEIAKEVAKFDKENPDFFSKPSEKDFIVKAQRVIHPSKKQYDWLVALQKKTSQPKVVAYPSAYNEDDPLDF